MKYLKMFESFIEISGTTGDMNIDNEIFYIARKYGIRKYKINEDGSIDVSGDVNLSYKGLSELPLKFRNITGDFYCNSNQLISLEGSPQSVGGYFYCNNNQLISLDGCPQTVGGSFFCDDNKLISLDGCPKSVGGDFYCDNNPCYPIYEEWIDTDRRDELLDMMSDYDFLRGETINWYLLEAFFVDAGLKIPNRKELEKYYTIED
jgi:hypothetical protein